MIIGVEQLCIVPDVVTNASEANNDASVARSVKHKNEDTDPIDYRMFSMLHPSYTTRKKMPCDTARVACDECCITRQFFTSGVTRM